MQTATQKTSAASDAGIYETQQAVIPTFNHSLRIELRANRLTGNLGAAPLREILERSNILARMMARLRNPRCQFDVTHDLASLIHTGVLLVAQGWRAHDGTDALCDDPAFRLADCSAARLSPLGARGGVGLAADPVVFHSANF